MAEGDPVLFERVDEHIALVTLNRPEKRHAVNGAVTRRLGEIVKQTEADAAIWAVVLTSSGGPTFCAGADLAEVSAGRAAELSTPDGGFGGFVEAKRVKPWIVAVRGSALGGGLEFSLACDLRVIGETTMLGLPEVKRGLIAGAGGVYRLPRQIPRAIALEMIALGEPIDARRAYALGLVNAVVPDETVVEVALDMARRICANAPISVRESLKIARAAEETPEAGSIAAMRRAMDALFATEDFKEGPRAFVEKRAPNWQGSLMAAPDVAARSRAELSGLFRARSIALVGATERSFWSNTAHANCEAIGFGGKLHLVNPKGGTAYGRPIATSCAAIGEPVDTALLMVPMAAIEDAVADCAAAGIRNAVVLTAGFAEMGEAGRTRQREMAALVRDAGINLLGPNCLGFLNLLDRVSIWTSTLAAIPSGNVAVVSQSGAVASYIVDYALQQGVGLGYVISTGNEADLSLARVVDFLVDDPRIKVVAAFMETARDAAMLAAAAEKARAAGKAIVALKIGAGALTAAAAQAHTGSIVGDDGVFTAACRRHNIVRAGSIEEMVATAEVIARIGAPTAPRLGVLSMSGGICEIAADRGEAVGAPIGPFGATTSARLGGLMPDYGTASNPLDVTGAAVGDPALFGRAVEAIASDPEIGLATVIFDMPDRPEGITFRVLQEIGATAGGAGAPAMILSTSVRPASDGIRATAEACGLRFLGHGIEHGMAAIAHAFRWAAGLAVAPPVIVEPVADRIARPSGERGTLDALAARGVPVVPGLIARTEEDAAAAAGATPSAFKIASPDIAHKSDIGGVILNVAGEEAARRAFRTILDRARAHAPNAAIDGVLVSPMREAGLELFVGILRDPDWGLAIAVGLGGVWVELIGDTSLRLLPVTRDDALAMLGELRATRLLDGYRGGEPADREAIADAIVALGEAALALGPSLAALEVNPLWVRGSRVEALDALATWNAD